MGMSYIFHKINGEWRAEHLATKRAAISFAPVRISALEPASCWPSNEMLELVRLEPGRKWIAIVPDNLKIKITHNGQPVSAQLRILAHGDLLAAADCEVFFSTEEAARIETFTGTEAVSCPRCKSRIEQGQPVVRCPLCSVVHHELTDRNCWSYSDKCALCDQPTALTAGLSWSPEVL